MALLGSLTLAVISVTLMYMYGGVSNRSESINELLVLLNRSRNTLDSESRVKLPGQKQEHKFVYLVQTEQCLPQRLLQTEHIGLSRACQCKVMVLSFKRRCNNHSLAHVEYLHQNDRLSWSAGRNFLYENAQSRGHPYLYYIFLDDDIEFYYNEARTPLHLMSISPLRAFEGFLEDYEPAVGVSNYEVHHNADIMLNKIEVLCQDKNEKKSTNRHAAVNGSSLIVPIVHFDASFNAFHRDAIKHILPYPTKFDQKCWWHSQRHVIAATELNFPGHSIMFMPVGTLNPKHGDYPRNDENANQIWSLIVNEMVAVFPSKFQEEKWVKKFMENPEGYTDNSKSICLKLPPHFPIRPYSDFYLNRTTEVRVMS